MKKSTRIALVLGVLVLLTGLAAFLADRKLKGLGHPGLVRFARQVAVNYPKGFQVDPIELELKVNDADMQRLQQVVEDARARGVIVPEGNEYVPAELISPDGISKAKVRIKGKLTDHVKGDKWSFRVIARKNGGFNGMRRFSLQHPGTRNYLYDWFYHKLMEGEGIVALRYGFVRLRFNDEDLGVYAYEEHFGPELLENNGRSEGPIFRFDPSLYWEHRLNEMRKLKVDGPYAEYQAASVDAFGSGEIAEDPGLRRQFEEAVALIEQFRRGKLSAPQVFDADKIARRHAILDLIGGHHSMDFSDVKFYYDPIAQRVEPVAYESFSAFKIRQLAGSYRFTGKFNESMDLHDAYFNDPSLFRLYVHHLERVSRRDYLDSAYAVLGPAMDSASAIIYQEFPWKEMDRSIFENNQKVIRRLLDVPKGFHAYLQDRSGDTLKILAVPIEALPVEVHSIDVGNGPIAPIDAVIVPARLRGRMGEPLEMHFAAGPIDSTAKITITYSVLGASVKKELEVFPYALELDRISLGSLPFTDLRSVPFIAIDEEKKQILLRSGSWAISSDLHLPEGYKVIARAPFELDLQQGARLISRSPIELKGDEEMPVRIHSSDKSGGSVLLLDAKTASKFDHVTIEDLGVSSTGFALLIFQSSPIEFSDCRIGGGPSRDLLQLVRSTCVVKNCTFAGGRDQFSSIYSFVKMDGADIYGAGDDAIVIRGGMVHLRNVSIENVKGTALKANVHAEIDAAEIWITDVDRGIDIGEGSSLKFTDGNIAASEIAIVVEKPVIRYGPVNAQISGVVIEAPEPHKIAGGNQVKIDGRDPLTNETTGK